MIEIASVEQFDEEIKEGLVVVDLYAPWCGPCKMIAPMLDALAEENPNVKFLKVNVDDHSAIADKMGAMSVPTIFTLVDGTVEDKSVGFLPKEALQERIDKLK